MVKEVKNDRKIRTEWKQNKKGVAKLRLMEIFSDHPEIYFNCMALCLSSEIPFRSVTNNIKILVAEGFIVQKLSYYKKK